VCDGGSHGVEQLTVAGALMLPRANINLTSLKVGEKWARGCTRHGKTIESSVGMEMGLRDA